MNKWYRTAQWSIFLMALAIVVTTQARVRTMQAAREFDQQLGKSNLMVVLFYDAANKRESRADQDNMRSFFKMYEAISSRKLYDDADLIFAKLNMKNQAVSTLVQRYAIADSPCFILFIKGKPVVGGDGKIVQLTGFVSEHELQEFINTYCMKNIKTMVNDKEQNRKERFIKSQEESDPYFYPAVYYAPEYDFSWQKPIKYDAEGNEIQ